MSQQNFYTKCSTTPQRWKGCMPTMLNLGDADAISVTLSGNFPQTTLPPPFLYPVGNSFPNPDYTMSMKVPLNTVVNPPSGNGFQLVGNDVQVLATGWYVISYQVIFNTFPNPFTGGNVATGMPGFPNSNFGAFPNQHTNITYIGINNDNSGPSAKAVDSMSFFQTTLITGIESLTPDIPHNSGAVVLFLNVNDLISLFNYVVRSDDSGSAQGTILSNCQLNVVRIKF